jgi:methyl-accepting chemotaxis protein
MSGAASREIRTLLDSSTKEVERLVAQSSQQALKMTTANRDSLDRGRQVVQDCVAVLDKVVEKVRNSAELANEIANATNKQAQDIAAIDSEINRLTKTTQRNSQLAEAALASAKAVEIERNSLDGAVLELTREINGAS